MRPRRRPPSRIPEINLVPMMDVLMTVLIFFVIISMGLTGVQINGVTLPSSSVEGNSNSPLEKPVEPNPFVIGLTPDKTLIFEGKPTSLQALAPPVEAYFKANPEGSLMLKADRTLLYEDIAIALSELRGIGGRRVSLAVE
jgi:biopolymer transport protein ExbD